MSDLSVRALEEHVQQRSPTHMSELARAVYFARLTSVLAVLEAHRSELHEDESLALLELQGLDKMHPHMLWVAALACHE